jgi:hypothetical protein
MITAFRINPDRCNGCHVTGRVVEFKIQPADGCYTTVRFCHGCSAELKAELQRIEQLEAEPDVDLFKEAPGWCMYVYGLGEAAKRCGKKPATTRKPKAVTRKKPATTRKTRKRTPGKARKRAGKTVKALRSP